MELITLVLVLAAGVLGWWFYRQRSSAARQSKETTVRLAGPGTYEFSVLGVSRYRSALESIYRDSAHGLDAQVDAVLVPELNRPESVRVDVGGTTVGHLPADLARAYRRRLVEAGHIGANGVCKARITARPAVGYTDFAIRLDLPSKHTGEKGLPTRAA